MLSCLIVFALVLQKLKRTSSECAVSVMFVGTQINTAMQISDQFDDVCGDDLNKLCRYGGAV